jgi:hypothetical protein
MGIDADSWCKKERFFCLSEECLEVEVSKHDVRTGKKLFYGPNDDDYTLQDMEHEWLVEVPTIDSQLCPSDGLESPIVLRGTADGEVHKKCPAGLESLSNDSVETKFECELVSYNETTGLVMREQPAFPSKQSLDDCENVTLTELHLNSALHASRGCGRTLRFDSKGDELPLDEVSTTAHFTAYFRAPSNPTRR